MRMNVMLIDNGDVPTPVARYTQPVSVPTPTVVQPLSADDPRNNDTFNAANPALAAAGTDPNTSSDPSNQPATDPQAIIAALLAQLQNSTGTDAALPLTTENAPPAINYSLDVSMLPASNGGFVPPSTDGTVTSDISSIPQPQAAVPPPVYALDTPANLYIDINSFTKNADGTYTANLTFDPVPGSVSKYNYRISGTS
jgi:hypothetical protein